MSRTTSHLVILTCLTGLVLFTNLGGPKLWDRDEPRNAGCAAEMLARGDWITPMFNDELRTHKPVLLYWLMMSAYTVFGVSEFSARFWSALLGGGTILLTYFIGRHLFAARIGFWAAIILATTLMFDVASRAATPDSTLIFFATAATTVYLWGTFLPATADRHLECRRAGVYFPQNWIAVAIMFSLMGLAVLTKGPMGLVLPTAVIGMFLLIKRLPPDPELSDDPSRSSRRHRMARWLSTFSPLHFLKTCWSMRPLTAIAMVTLVAVPWYVWVAVRTQGDWPRGFFWEHNLGRAMQPMEGHGGGLWFYPVAILIGFFPWSIFAIPTILHTISAIRRRTADSTGLLFVTVWAAVYVGLFSIARTKLPSYITPCYPALALATAIYVQHLPKRSPRVRIDWPWISLACLALTGVAIMIGLPMAADRYLPGERWLGTLGLIPIFGAGVGILALRRDRRHWLKFVQGCTAAMFCAGMFAIAAPQVDRHQQSTKLLATANVESQQLGAYGCLEPSWVFYAGRPIQVLSRDNRSATTRKHPWQIRPAFPSREFLSSAQNMVITTNGFLDELETLVQGKLEVVQQVPYFLKDERLILVRKSPSTTGGERTAKRVSAPSPESVRTSTNSSGHPVRFGPR